MLHGPVRAAARLRLPAALLAAATLAGGVVLLRDASVDVLPELSPPYVEIQTEALGLSANEVEEFITVPLEANMLSGVAWVESISSQSVPGLSSIILTFEPGTDLLRARQVVQERLTQAHSLPRVSRPPAMLQPLSSSSRVMMISLTSDELSLIDLSVLARWNIRPRLMGVEGVANVAVWGQRERQLQVLVDPARLNEHGVSLSQIIHTAGNSLWVSQLSFLNASTPGAGGFIETPNQRLGVRHVQPISTAEELAEVRIEGSTLRLGDVADVVEDHQPLIGDARTTEGDGLLLVVERLPGADVPAVTAGIEDALAALAPGLDGVQVDTSIYRAATFIETATSNTGLALLIGLLLTVLSLLALGYDWRGTVVTLLAATLAVTVGALAVRLTGGTINGVVLAGLLGASVLVLLDATLHVSRLQRDLDELHPDGADARAEVAAAATVKARQASAYVTVLALLPLLPLVALEGLNGALVGPFVMGLAGPLIASALIGYFVTPALAASLMRPRRLGGRGRTGAWQGAERAYARLLPRIVPRIGAAAVAVVVVLLVVTVPLLGLELIPRFTERDLVVTMRAAPGTSGPASGRLVDSARTKLLEVAGVRDVTGQVGRAVMSDEVGSVDTSQLWISLHPDAPYEPTLAAVWDVLNGVAGVTPIMETYLGQRVAQIEASRGDAVTVRLYGPSPDVLEEQAAAVRLAMADVPGVTGVQIESLVSEQQVEVEVDLASAGRHGLKPGDIRRAASTLISGIEVGSLFEDQKVFEVVVWGVPELRESVDSLGALLIDKGGGEQVTLNEVADVRLAMTNSVINREGISRRLDVTATVGDADPVAVAQATEDRIRQLPFPLEYHAEVDQSAVEDRAARDSLLGLAAAALVGVLLLLQAAFNSWRLAAVALVVPLAAAVGGLAGVLLTGGVLSLGSIAGLLILAGLSTGIAVRVIQGYGGIREDAAVISGPDPVPVSVERPLGLFLLMALPPIALLLPFVLFGQVAGLEFTRPLAIALLGGLLASVLFGALVLPAISRPSAPRAVVQARTSPVAIVSERERVETA